MILLIKNELVENAIVAELEDAQASFPDYTCIYSEIGGIGWAYVDGNLIEPEAPAPTVELGILSTDTWSIPADGTTFATVQFTSDTTVYFAVESTITAVDPIGNVATLEITADAPGPIRVDVQDKRLVIVALEVE